MVRKSKSLFKRLLDEPAILFLLGGIVIALIAGGISLKITTSSGTEINLTKNESSLVMSSNQRPAYITDDRGEVIETNSYEGEEIKTYEEVDGGLFEDIYASEDKGEYDDLGWSETFNVSSPEAFMEDTINKCIIAGNRYGAQCVSLARAFWWSYADRDVSTCGTGMAKGMMNCADANAGDDFVVYWSDSKNQIQAGDWLVFDGGRYGHIGMALGGNNDGYVALLGENQGGHSCGDNVGGSATNIINISLKNLIGFYRPKAYIKVEPTPTPIPVSNCSIWHVLRGDTMSKIMLECEGTVKYGEAMDAYAKSWYSLIYNQGKSVYDGWASESGIGLFENDDIEHRI